MRSWQRGCGRCRRGELRAHRGGGGIISREASELTSLSRTGLGKLSCLARKSGLLIPAGPTCRRDEKLQEGF
ncbi:uncharacterized [Lates japonicus]